MMESLTLVNKWGRRISLEHNSHPCPKCKHHASVRLTRYERKWTVLNKCISYMIRVSYECGKCKWKNEELPDFPTNNYGIEVPF
ncbi:hypothetical protein BDB01DRAFT_785484 [Pilobolus umbonatus]|nr:hypothetical protein BDB01DRAFT_785484 [Pilobolus umbonatus]